LIEIDHFKALFGKIQRFIIRRIY